MKPKDVDKKNESQIDVVKESEPFDDETLEQVKGGTAAEDISVGCCGIQLSCHNKGKSEEKLDMLEP